jgi:hypothetical protein
MKLRADQTGDRGLPMPLWLQGALETAQAACISALVVIVPIIAVWATAGVHNSTFDVLARLAGQSWLLIHGVPLELFATGSNAAAKGQAGVLFLIPLGLTLLPFLLAWRAGRRLARASYTDQLWQALLGSWVVYAAFGTATGFVCRTPDVGINPWHAMMIPLIPYALGMVIGARRGLDFTHQPAFTLGRLLPRFGCESRIRGGRFRPCPCGSAAGGGPVRPLEPCGCRL